MVQPLTYEALKIIAVNDATVQANLEDLKCMFRSEIGSARNLYRIHTAADLIDCLERHDALSEYNVEPLREIADEFGGTLAVVIANYHMTNKHLNMELRNEYQEMRLAYECSNRLNISSSMNGYNCGPQINTTVQENNTTRQPVFRQELSKDKRKAIYKLISGDIGTDWRCLGRELEVCQGDMDNIEIQYRDLRTRVDKLFQVFEENDSIDSKEHLLIICRALDECRRKDLRRKVEKIMSH